MTYIKRNNSGSYKELFKDLLEIAYFINPENTSGTVDIDKSLKVLDQVRVFLINCSDSAVVVVEPPVAYPGTIKDIIKYLEGKTRELNTDMDALTKIPSGYLRSGVIKELEIERDVYRSVLRKIKNI